MKLFTKRGQTNFSRLSQESLCIEQHQEQEPSDTEPSRSETESPVVIKRYSQFYQQAIADVRQSPIKFTLWLFSTVFFAAVNIIIIKLKLSESGYDGCSSDGSIWLDHIYLWATSDFFQVNIAAGNLTFTRAKTINTSWDLPVTFATYRMLFADSGSSISSTASLLYDFVKFRGLTSRWAGTFLIYSINFSLAFPTLAGSTTGYTTLNEGLIHTDDNNLISITNWYYITTEYSHMSFESVILQRGICVPVKDRYQWGASFLQIFWLLVAVALWIIGCLALTLSSHAQYQVAKDTEVPKGYQATGILVRTIDAQLTGSNVKTSTTSDQLLKTAIKTKLGGGSISFGVPGQIATFRQWLAKERRWFICLCVWAASTLSCMSSQFGSIPLFLLFGLLPTHVFYWLSPSTLYAILVGQTSGSRPFLILYWKVPGIGISVVFIQFIPL
ncbi:hypothetical protein RRF57_003028 [Xylaria bambusicola]|uniref:Uncharacterized protein n=1 Tax=Xylaria bambusicola TaxID=326684 RepID=A0AAN7UEG8_9PEZI